MQIVVSALAKYGATLGEHDRIQKGEKLLPVRVVIKAGRIHFESIAGQILGSGPIAESAVESFIERFWMWEKTK
jgi:hypothetical protein